MLLLRRTLVLVNSEWAMANKSFAFFIDHSALTIDKHVPNAQVSDTTGDDSSTAV